MVLMVLSRTHLTVWYLPTYLPLKMSPSSLCNSWKERPPPTVLGKMDGPTPGHRG